MFGLVGSNVESVDPTGYQCDVQSNEAAEEEGEAGEVESGAGGDEAAAAARAASEEGRAGRGSSGDEEVDDSATRKKATPFPCAVVCLAAALGKPRPAAAPAEHGVALSIAVKGRKVRGNSRGFEKKERERELDRSL